MRYSTAIDFYVLGVFLFILMFALFLLWLLIVRPFIFFGLCVGVVAFWYFALHQSTVEVDKDDENF